MSQHCESKINIISIINVDKLYDVYKALTEFSICPSCADWEFPKYGLSLKYHEVNTTIKILKWVLNK